MSCFWRTKIAQYVKYAVSESKSKGALQAETLPRNYRPWGWYESIAIGLRFQVKWIFVKSGAALLTKSKHRSEHWIIVEGTVTIDD